MATFPILRTGALAQYPLETTTRFRNDSVQFLDGSRQTFPLQGRALRQWAIRLDLLDDMERSAITEFVESAIDGTFLFTDPATGEASIKCVVDGGFRVDSTEELRSSTTLKIREVI